jgi:hypothetical protein
MLRTNCSHSERSEAESKDPVEATLKIAQWGPSISLGMTMRESVVL